MSTVANLTLEGGDPRNPNTVVALDHMETELIHEAHNRSIPFEAYVYYAEITRAEEKAEHEELTRLAGPKTLKSIIKNRFSTGKIQTPVQSETPELPASSSDEKQVIVGDGERAVNPTRNFWSTTDDERKKASRAVRTAGWSSMFFLITTDILGPTSTGWAFAQMGWGPAVALYTVFGALAM